MTISDSALPSLQGSFYFAVGPFIDLGSRVDVACRALGWDAIGAPPCGAGYVFVMDGQHVRADPGDSQSHVHALARAVCSENSETILVGEAKFTIGERVLYRAIEMYKPVLPFILFAKAHEAADEILEGVFKARANIDPSKPGNRAIIIRRTADAMVAKARPWERSATVAGRKFLDENWPELAARERNTLVRRAADKIRSIPVRAVPGLNDVISVEANGVYRGARRSVIRRFKLNIGANLTLPDERAIKSMQRTTVSWITDEYRKRASGFEDEAKRIVEAGMERGLGRTDISNQLMRQFGTSVSGRSQSYYTVYAGAIIDRSRTRSELHSYREAGITKYIASAVLDEVTTEFCRYIDGKIIDVEESISIQEQAEQPDMTPEEMKRANPWVRMGLDDEGNRFAYVNGPSGRSKLFRVRESGMGTQTRGAYSTLPGGNKLAANGVGGPPYHGNCRTTTIIET